MTKCLCDLHHADLFYSLQLLFEKRFGFELYRPIGLEWYTEGYWNVFPHIDTAKQFLGLDQAINPPKDVHGNFLEERAQLNKYYRFEDGIYYVTDVTKDKIQRGITLEKFKNMEFDIIVSSMPQHVQPFNKLISLYQPKAKHIFQVGNAWGQQPGVKNILASTAPFSVSPDINICYYHQEFDLEVFNYERKIRSNNIHSFIHYMNKEYWNKMKSQLVNFNMFSYGAGMDACICKTSEEAERYKEAKWTWYFKPGGDGYGYALYRTMATGTPLLVWGQHCRGKFAQELLIDKQTCIDLSIRSVYENALAIQRLSQPEEHLKMQENCYKRFNECVNFNEEFEKIKIFLGNLK